jgi:hypothetical protein
MNRDYTPPILNKKVSPGIIPRFPSLEALRVQSVRTINKSAPWLVVYIRKLRLAEIYRKLNSDNRPDRFKVDAGVIDELCAYYHHEIHCIEGFLGRKLDLWESKNL